MRRDKNCFLVINLYVDSISSSVKKISQDNNIENPVILVLTSQSDAYQNLDIEGIELIVLHVDFSDKIAVDRTLKPFLESIVAVICRGDGHIQYLRKVIPLLTDKICVPTKTSLEISTNKQLMRQSFKDNFPEISPKFLKVTDYNTDTIDMIERTITYPVIVKPASLVSSLLIQSCDNRHQLSSAMKEVFTKIDNVYSREKRTEEPIVIVEEFLSGEFYSIDVYRLGETDFFFCPPVKYLPAKSLGIDDFYLYKRWLPSDLAEQDIFFAKEVCKKALIAVGLTYSVAHIELIKTDSGWKVIELGPRLGRFRKKMYEVGYGIDHSTNDILVRMGQNPKVKSKHLEYCAAYSIYPHSEGTLKEVSNIDKLESLKEVVYLKRMIDDGAYCHYAKNGGKAIVEVIISTPDLLKFNEVCDFIEKNVGADIY